MAAARPVILLAFANDPADGVNYLRNLPEEARRLRAALEYAEAQGLCEFEVRYNATLDDILAAFQHPKLRGRVAVFHYGGHAESYDLLLQSGPGNLQRIDGRGFAAFLAEQRGLQLVFLNACTTEPQVESLLAANVPVAIATTQEVDDSVAAELAARFYGELAHGASIGAAYRQAVAALRAAKGDDPALFYAPGGAPPDVGAQASSPADAGAQASSPADAGAQASSPAPASAGVEAGGGASGGFWPWLLRTRRGAEAAVEWSLPQAAGDPLFGLPPLPARPLPDSPYQRALDYYTRDLAELFFGRGRQIRDLYQRVTAAGHASVLLYYGQSGVGKSSLLDAGLAPRLAATHAVIYARRDRGLGLLGTLERQLAEFSARARGQAQPADPGNLDLCAPDLMPLPQAWLAAEQRLGQPVVLILDQVEEVFSRRNPEQPQELAEFAAALAAIDGGGGRPAGALLLGFRKERLAEIETALRDQRVDFAKLFLGPLDEEGIQEVFWGPVRSERLKAKYNLSVEDDLPALVAHDLTADPDSPVAPTLNILLRKLWAAATAQAASAPHFTAALYEHLRRDGILLDDFLRQQTATLAQEQPDAVTSGLLLDLWAFHTTALGTSDQRDAAEIKAAYGQQPSIEALILRSKELYVLADPPGDNTGGDNPGGATGGVAGGVAGSNGGTRLAHDTLAPLVRRDYATSTLPGQQARRLLESRAIDWEAGRSGPLLDDAALGVIDKGLAGMRGLSEAEQRLLSASRAAQTQRARRRRLWRGVAAAVALVVLALLAATLLSWENGRLQGERADAADARAESEAAKSQAAAAQSEAAEERSRAEQLRSQLADEREQVAVAAAQVNEARRLAALAQQQLASDPVVSLHLALAAQQAAGQSAVPEADYALRQAVLGSREREYLPAAISLPDQVALRGDRLAVGGPAPAIYDVELNPQSLALPDGFQDIEGLRWGNDMRLLGWNSQSVWIVGGGAPRQFPLPLGEEEQVRCAEWQPAQEWVAVCTWNNLYAWQPASGRVITVTTELDTPDLPVEPRSARWSPDGRRLAGLGAKLALWDSAAPGAAATVFYPPAEPGQWVAGAVWLPDSDSLAALWTTAFGDTAPQLHIWRAGAEELETAALPAALGAALDQLQLLYAPDPQSGAPRLLLWSGGTVGLLGLYDLAGNELGRAAEVPAFPGAPLLSPDGELALSYGGDGTAIIWWLPDFSPMTTLDRASRFVAGPLTSAAWLDERAVVLGDSSGLLQVVTTDDLSNQITITRLAGSRAGEQLGMALRLADGRLLTVGLTDDPAGGSLRIWQLAPTLETGAGLPPTAAPLCRRLQRAIELPPDLPSGETYAWQPDGALIVGDRQQAARWQPGGALELLPPDETLYTYALASDKQQLLRYGDGTAGAIWQLAATGWQQTPLTITGPIAQAVWGPHGILVDYSDGASALVDPQSGGRRPLPTGTRAVDSAMLTPDLLLAASDDAIRLWRLDEARELAALPVPDNLRLGLDAGDAARGIFVWRSFIFGELYVAQADAAQGTLRELWRSTAPALNRSPSALHPALPLAATVDNGVVQIIDLAAGEIVWQSSSVAAVADQNFLAVQWSTGGQYLVTQAQPPSSSTFRISIGVWRWDADSRRLTLLQEMPSAGLLATSPDGQTVLALAPAIMPGSVSGAPLWVYPILADAAQLRQEVMESCLLTRDVAEERWQAFGVRVR